MKRIAKYQLIKNDQIIAFGISPTFYIHGMVSSLLEKQDADRVIITFDNGATFNVISPKLLFKMQPTTVSIEDHQRWFSGCRHPLDLT